MYKSPSRNQRSKGIKVKHVVQTCLLLAICIWLVYQVKHSHDKKKEVDQDDAKASMSSERKDDVLKLGRKDLYPRVEETTNKNGRHNEVLVEENTGKEEQEEEDSKLEEEQQGDSMSEEKENEGRGDNSEDVDDHDQENSDGKSDRVEQFVEDEKEAEDSDEEGSAEKDSEHIYGQMESNSLLGKDHKSVRNTNEAREENYKADDASSAVSQDNTQMSSVFNETVDLEKDLEHPEMIIGQMTTSKDTTRNNGDQHASLKLEDSETAHNGSNLSASVHEVNESMQRNSSVAEGSSDLQKETETRDETFSSSGNVTVRETQGNNLTSLVNNIKLDSNLTINLELGNMDSRQGDLKSSGDSETSILEVKSNLSAKAEDSSGSSLTGDNRATYNVKDDETGVVIEGLHEATSVISDEMKHGHIDSSNASILWEEKDVHTDLETLPEVQTEGSSRDNE